jgi:hypothetical protein
MRCIRNSARKIMVGVVLGLTAIVRLAYALLSNKFMDSIHKNIFINFVKVGYQFG